MSKLLVSYLGISNEHNYHIYSVEPSIDMEYAIITHDLNDLTPVANKFIYIIEQLKEEVF